LIQKPSNILTSFAGNGNVFTDSSTEGRWFVYGYWEDLRMLHKQ